MDKKLEQMIKTSVNKHHSCTIDLSNDLYANPEISHKEYESSRKMADILRKNGYEVEYPFMGYETAFCGVLDNGVGPNVAILVEYDALPEIGHACGHNLHGALSILSALTLMELKECFKGKLYIIGTPAEEDDGAKIGMANKGIFDKMSVAMMMHSGDMGVYKPDMDALSLRCYVIEFHGKTAHSAGCPWEGRSALAAARKFLDLIDARRECFTPDIRVNGIILDGGKAPNIIPEHAEIRLEFRTNSRRKLNDLDDAIIKCAKGAAMALDCEVTWKPGLSDFDDMVCVPSLIKEMSEIIESLGGKVSPVSPPAGSTDMGNVSYHCPAIQPLVPITKNKCPVHTVEFAEYTTKPEALNAMATGAEILTIMALKMFNDEELRNRIYKDFKKQLEIKNNM